MGQPDDFQASGAESAVIVPALDVDPLISEFRPVGSPGSEQDLPAHLTVMYPFVEPHRLSRAIIAGLQAALSRMPAFDYTLTSICQFTSGVLYLAPEPPDPFISLTELVSRKFGLRPYDGAYGQIVPHLTVASVVGGESEMLTARLASMVPRLVRASEVWVVTRDVEVGWRRHTAVPLRHG